MCDKLRECTLLSKVSVPVEARPESNREETRSTLLSRASVCTWYHALVANLQLALAVSSWSGA
eukprot:754827-Hanusia_phi.AAC.5